MLGNVYQCVCGGVERENASGQIEEEKTWEYLTILHILQNS